MSEIRIARITGSLTVEDMARHVGHSVKVPEGFGTLGVRFGFAPDHPGAGDVPHQLSISVYDPLGPRGTRHCNPDQSPVLSRHWASPGYTPGSITAGDWLIEIDTHRILPPGQIGYELEVWVSADETGSAGAARPAVTSDRGPGWYRGDLHGHSMHSDAQWSVTDFVAYARHRALDFVTLTDHNTVSGLAELRSMAGDDLLVIGGVELTTFHGHALAIPATEWVEWRIRDGYTMSARARRIMAAGQLFIIAHPMSVGHPWCTGCHWAYADTYPGPARLVEVWNGPWDGDSNNELSLSLAHSWLNRGHAMRLTAGSDVHGPYRDETHLGTNTVRAEALTAPAILAAVARGHSYLSSGPTLDLTVQAGAETAMMGDRLSGAATARLRIGWAGTEPSDTVTVRSGHAGAEVAAVLWCGAAGAEGSRTVDWAPDALPGWANIEVRAAAGQVRALSNPVFLGPATDAV